MRSMLAPSFACLLVACGGAPPPVTAPSAPAAAPRASEAPAAGIVGTLFEGRFAGAHAVYAQVDPSAPYGTLRVFVAAKPLDCAVIADRDAALRGGGIEEALSFDLKPLKAGPKDGSYPLTFSGPVVGHRLRLGPSGVTSGGLWGTLDLAVKPEGLLVKLPDGKIGDGGAVVISGAVLAKKCPTKGS